MQEGTDMRGIVGAGYSDTHRAQQSTWHIHIPELSSSARCMHHLRRLDEKLFHGEVTYIANIQLWRLSHDSDRGSGETGDDAEDDARTL